jgi:5-methylcytosine-specific restriction endonuclease McrA
LFTFLDPVNMTHRQKLYREYLRTDAWKRKADQARANAGFQCQFVWNGARCTERATEAHHTNYTRLFHELPADLMACCRKCHKRVHHILEMVANDNQLTLPFEEEEEAS